MKKPVPKSANPSENCPEKNAANSLSRIILREKATSELQRYYPKLFRLYDEIFEPRLFAMAEKSHDFHSLALTFLFDAISPHLIQPILHCFLNNQSDTASLAFKIDDISHFYPQKLLPIEQTIYGKLDPDLQTVFRICRSLASVESDSPPHGVFYLSAQHLADRLGCHGMQAHRLLGKFGVFGVVRKVKPGKKWEKGQPREASSYRWLLSLPN